MPIPERKKNIDTPICPNEQICHSMVGIATLFPHAWHIIIPTALNPINSWRYLLNKAKFIFL